MWMRRRMSIKPDALHGRAHALADAHHVALGDQVLDDVRARRRRAESLLVHRGRELLVLDVLAGVLHQREQARLGDARRRLGLFGATASTSGRGDADAGRLGRAGDQRRQRRRVLLRPCPHRRRAPARLHERARAGAEALARDVGDALDALPDRGRVEVAEEAARHQIEELRSSPETPGPGTRPVGMIAKWSETLVSSKVRASFSRPAASSRCAAAPYSAIGSASFDGRTPRPASAKLRSTSRTFSR